MRRQRLLVLALAVVVALAFSATACSSDGSNGHPALTESQAQELSMARFSTYRLGTVSLDATFSMHDDATELSGWVDFRTGVGYAASIEAGTPRNLLMWTHRQIALTQVTGTDATPPMPEPELDSSWGTARVNAARSELQQILVVIISLGSDRPDNALLVAQNGARYLRTDHIGDESMTVYAVPPNPTGTPASIANSAASAAPASTTAAANPDTGDQRTINYWIDSAGAIRRATFTLASGTEVAVNLARDADAPRLHDPFGAAP